MCIYKIIIKMLDTNNTQSPDNVQDRYTIARQLENK